MLFGVPWLFGTFCTSQVVYHRSMSGCPLKMKHGFLITDWHFWQSWPYSCVTLFSHSLRVSPGLFICLSISLTHTLLSVSLHLLVDCNKTLALQFMFAPLAPSPAQPQLLPVVHGSGSLPSAKGIYSWNYTHCVFQAGLPTSFPLYSTPSGGSGGGGLNYTSRHPERRGSKGFHSGWRVAVEHKHSRHCVFCTWTVSQEHWRIGLDIG